VHRLRLLRRHLPLRHLYHEAVLAHMPGITGEKEKGSGWLSEPFLRLLRLRKSFHAARKYFLTV
jgi:hypothetical protein